MNRNRLARVRSIIESLREIGDEEAAAVDNTPENLQGTEAFQKREEWIETLVSAADELEGMANA